MHWWRISFVVFVLLSRLPSILHELSRGGCWRYSRGCGRRIEVYGSCLCESTPICRGRMVRLSEMNLDHLYLTAQRRAVVRSMTHFPRATTGINSPNGV